VTCRAHMGGFYASSFDPVLVLAQIVALQCAFYLVVGVWLLLFASLFGAEVSVGALLSGPALNYRHVFGWPPILAFLLVVPPCAYLLVALVGRARLCLDFVATAYAFHLLICLGYAGLPTNFEWWLVNGLALVGTVVFGELLCQRREMEDIPIGAQFVDAKGRRREKLTPRASLPL